MTRWKEPFRRPCLILWQGVKFFFGRLFQKREKSPWKEAPLRFPLEEGRSQRGSTTRLYRNRRKKYGGTAQRKKYRRTTARKRRAA